MIIIDEHTRAAAPDVLRLLRNKAAIANDMIVAREPSVDTRALLLVSELERKRRRRGTAGEPLERPRQAAPAAAPRRLLALAWDARAQG
ncbi:hypothetical protein [Marinimicrococcus flavescens]|uniref:Uncharacterized protein n=1 Tax=Marinimicrococcus flavescens TaxID=3031815 RepID=A0AAP3XPD5_9PROT|nr:hypothetical protein [Marinimicrococcus flavescens]